MKKNYFKSLAQVAMLLCVPLFIASCDEFGDEDNPTPSYISMKTDAVTIKKGDTYTRTALAASSAVIEYKSEDEAIATVNATTGEVTGKADGTTNIVAVATGYSTGGKKIYLTEEVKYELTVQDPVSSFAYDFGEAGVPKQIYAGTDVKFEPVEPQKSSGVLHYTYVVQYKATAAGAYGAESPLPADGKFVADAAGFYKVTAKTTVPADYKPYVTSHANTEASYEIQFDAGVTYARWNGTAFEDVTVLESDFDDIFSGGIPTGVLAGGTYYINADANINGVKISGDVNFVLKDGINIAVNLSGIDEDDPANPHTLNFYKSVEGTTGSRVYMAGWITSDMFKNIGTINTYKVDINATSSAEGCGGFANIGAINIYDADVNCSYTGTSYGYGAKMKNGGTITLYKGSFAANGGGTDETYSKAVIGKLACDAAYVFKGSDDSTDGTDGTWAKFTNTSDKLWIKSVDAE